MVATRNHPKEFPEPGTPSSSPTKSSPTKATSSPSKPSSPTPNSNTAATTTLAKTPTRSRSTATSSPATIPGYVHTPDRTVIIWLLVSLPFIFWDTLYVLLRPHTMPGGKFHSPIWSPYALYGTIDYMYGWPAWDARNGFTAAQGSLNAVEFAMDLFYLWVVFANGKVKKVDKKKDFMWLVWEEKKVEGGGLAVLVLWGAALMTFSKTVLYWLNEAYSGFDNIGHNDLVTLILLWIIPNGLWLILPAYMICVVGMEIWTALDAAGAKKSR